LVFRDSTIVNNTIPINKNCDKKVKKKIYFVVKNQFILYPFLFQSIKEKYFFIFFKVLIISIVNVKWLITRKLTSR